MPDILDQATLFQEFTNVIPASVSDPFRSHICGGHAELHRYNAAAEKADSALGEYISSADTNYQWPDKSDDSIVDLSFVEVWFDNAYLKLYTDPIGGGGTIAPVSGYSNRVRSSVTSWKTNGAYARSAAMNDRDVIVGDTIRIDLGGETLWTTVAGFVAEEIAASIASASTDSGNQATQSSDKTVTQSAGADNYITLTTGNVDITNYDGTDLGDVGDVYTFTVTQGSVGADATTARLTVTTASGRDNVSSVTPAAFGTAFAVGDRNLRVTFTSDSSRPVDSGEPSGDFVVGQTWQVTVLQAWTKPVPTSGGTYADTVDRQYTIAVSRGGLYQVPLPIDAPTTAPTVNATGGGAGGGLLQAGTYYVQYTWVNAAGETTVSPESSQFTVAAGNIPLVTIPALPTDVTSAKIYLTPTNGASGTEVFYKSGVTGTTTTLATRITIQPPAASTAVGTVAAPSAAPTVSATGGGSGGGSFQVGTFRCKYTFTNATGESPASPESGTFTVSAGNIPRVTFAALPTGATGIKLYVTPANAPAGMEVILYASGIASTTHDMTAASTYMPPTANNTSPSVADPAASLTVSVTGGGSTGGKLPPGSYYVKINYNGTAGQTLASAESASFTVANGNIPRVSGIPSSAPTNATTFNVWLTPAGGGSGSEILYASGVTFASTYDLTNALPTTSPAVPGADTTNPAVTAPSVAPVAAATGGGSIGGNLPAGAYYVKYTWRNSGGETTPSPESALLTVAAGNIPRITVPALATNATSATIYLTPTDGGTGTQIKYQENVTSTTVDLSAALPVGPFIPTVGSATFTVTDPSTAPTVNTIGGGSTGGNLPAGTYKAVYTVYGNVTGESLSQGTEVTFTIAAGNIPQVTVGTLPGGASGATIYLTQVGGASGSETRFPSAVNQAGPTINLNATATSALVTLPPSDTTATYTGDNPEPPQIVVVSTGSPDSSGPTSVTAAATNVAVGSKGVLVQFTGTGLRAGDYYSIQATGVSQGAIKTLVLQNNLTSAMQAAADLTLTLYIKKTEFQLAAQRLSAPPAVNWSATASLLTIKAGATAYDPTWTSSGTPIAVPVVSGPDTVVYAHYRAWLPTYAAKLNTITDIDNVESSLGTVDPDNPLAFAVYKALQNANGTAVAFSAVEDPAVLENWTDVLEILVGLKNIRTLVPLSTDSDVLDAYRDHILARSDDDVGGEWRVGLFSLEPVTSLAVVTDATTTDEENANATIGDDPETSGNQYTLVTCTTANGQFVTNEVAAGDVFRYIYSQDAYGTPSWTEYIIAEVVNQDTLKLASGPDSPVSVTQKFEIWRSLSKRQIAQNLAGQITAASNKRFSYVWPNEIDVAGVAVPGYFVCAALAAYLGGVAPQQGVRYTSLTGFDAPVTQSTDFFNNAHLNILRTAGCTIVTSDSVNGVYISDMLTSDQSSTDNGLEQLVRNDDGIKYLVYGRVAKFFGKANITPTALNMIQAEVTSGIQLGKSLLIERSGPVLTDGTIDVLKQHATIKDKVILVVSAERSYPVNNAGVSLTLLI